MLSPKTVFVVGAGASKELGLPIGEELKPLIAEVIRPSSDDPYRAFANESVDNAVRSYLNDHQRHEWDDIYTRFKRAALVMSEALPFALSIDQYLDSQRGDETVVKMGKIGIAAAILRAECDSKIGKVSPRTGRLQGTSQRFPSVVGSTWHLKLIQLVTAGKSKQEVETALASVAFIVFNYDRCLEYYLTLALTRYYGDDPAWVRRVVGSMTIVHPYGQVGSLEHGDGVSVSFGGTAQHQLKEIAEGLLTFTESDATGVTEEVKELMSEAETLVFMGFGFLPQNVDLLTCLVPSLAKRVFYTTLGISRTDVEFVEFDLEDMLRKPRDGGATGSNLDPFQMFEVNGTCLALMESNWMRLTRQPRPAFKPTPMPRRKRSA